MRKARFLRYSNLDDLRKRIGDNLAPYRKGDFSYIVTDSSRWFEHDVEIDAEHLKELAPPNGQNLYEAENCATLYEAMRSLSPYEARDERLWVYLTHADLLEYTRQR